MKKSLITWDARFSRFCPRLFKPLIKTSKYFAEFNAWPTLADYQCYFEETGSPITSAANHPIRFVAQDVKPRCFQEGYEPRIYHRGEVQTRHESWHDFFQVLIWRTFPKTKVTLNHQHYMAGKARLETEPKQPNRSPLENALTLFDECGAIIVSSDDYLLDLIRQSKWKKLFWDLRIDLQDKLHCFIFGHALYEKALKPYIGMTAHATLLNVDNLFHAKPLHEQMSEVDALIASLFSDHDRMRSPRDLNPFPVLGMPGWIQDNDKEAFYDNRNYFRMGKERTIP